MRWFAGNNGAAKRNWFVFRAREWGAPQSDYYKNKNGHVIWMTREGAERKAGELNMAPSP